MKTLKIGVCKGRHEMPCDYYIFNEEIKFPLDFEMLEIDAYNGLMDALREFEKETSEEYNVQLYITGLTAAVISCLKAFKKCHIYTLELMHYDISSGEYIAQSWGF